MKPTTMKTDTDIPSPEPLASKAGEALKVREIHHWFPCTEAGFKTKVDELIGEASMQWNPRPSGVFDSTGALRIADQIMELIVTELESPSLGCATTGELIELKARAELGGYLDYRTATREAL